MSTMDYKSCVATKLLDNIWCSSVAGSFIQQNGATFVDYKWLRGKLNNLFKRMFRCTLILFWYSCDQILFMESGCYNIMLSNLKHAYFSLMHNIEWSNINNDWHFFQVFILNVQFCKFLFLRFLSINNVHIAVHYVRCKRQQVCNIYLLYSSRQCILSYIQF